MSNHLLYEYEEILTRDRIKLGLSISDIDQILNAICARSEEWLLSPAWRPILNDPDDEPLVQLAVESDAHMIATHNFRHLVAARQIGVEVLNPAQFLGRVRKQ